ncbi:MAG: ABC transporter permease subunit [Erysipelotrichaceae bacterium]|nr:ABC transporter permease subunit [Erysipelotrichaceae bacterium]
MFKRELKINLKNFIIWASILVGLFLVVFLIYPSIINSENMEMIDEMMALFPEEVLKAFNMDISSIDSAFGWLKTEGFVFVLLLTGIYSGILGSNILLKEESDKTIEYLNSVPVTRSDIVLSRIFSGLFYIVLLIVTIGAFNYIGLAVSGDFDRKSYLLLSVTPLFSSIVIFSICLFLSTFTHKTKKTLGISLGLVFVSYFLNVLSEMGESTKFLKYISVFTLADIRNVIVDVAINPLMVVISIGITAIFLILTWIRYEKKELV